MIKESVITLLLQPLPIWIAIALGLVPALIAGFQRRPIGRWCLYGFGCVLLAWPLIAFPTIHAFLAGRGGKPTELDRQRQRRCDALALLKERSVRSFPSRIGDLGRRTASGIDRRRYVYERLRPGEALELVRERGTPKNAKAVAYHHRGVHLGYVPKRQYWIADALDDGIRLLAIAETVKMGWLFRRRARYVGTRIIIIFDPR
jgi:hypothetical protein